MSGPLDFTNENIENTYQRVLQTDGTLIYDGTGSLFTVTAVAAPAGPDQSVQFNDAGATSGSGTFTFDKNTNTVNISGSLVSTGSILFPSITSTNQVNVLTIDTASGQLYYTASSAFGGGTTTSPGNPNKSIQFNGNGIFSGSNNLTFDSASNSMILTGSMVTTGSNLLIGNTILSGTLQIQGQYPSSVGSQSVSIIGNTDLNGFLRFDPVQSVINTAISGAYIYVTGSTNDLYFAQNIKGYTNNIRLRWIEGNMYSGLLSGGVIGTKSSTVYTIESGSGIIVNLNASLSDDPYPTVQYINWSTLSASIAPLSASYDQTFVAISSSGGTGTIFAQGTPFIDGQFDTLIPIGLVLHQNRSTINGIKTQPNVAYALSQRANVFIKAFGPLKITGFALSPSGSSTGSLVVGAGTAYADGANYITDPNNPSYVIDAGTNISKIYRYYQSGSGWIYDTNAGAGYPTIDPTRYSLDGVLTAVPGTGTNRQWSNQRVFWFPNSVAKAIVVYYGNTTYSSQLEAIAASVTENFTEAPNTAANAVYLGYITVRNNATFTDATSFKIVPAGLFRGSGGGGGGGAGSSILLQTNGTNNGSQTVLNLKQGSNVSLSDDGVGGITISSTGGGSGNNTATGSYGSFYDTTIQTIGTVGAVYSMSLNNAPISNGVSLSGSTNPYNTYIKMANAGVYDIQFSAQLDKTTGTNGIAYIWLRKNGTDLPETNTAVTLAGGANDKALAAWNWFVDASAGDYFQLIWAATNNNIRLYSTGSGAIDASPAIPSLIVTANRIDQFLSNTGSFTGSFTGELIGTASWASNAVTASYVTGSIFDSGNPALSASYALSSSYAESSSYSDTASYASNGLPTGTSGQILQIDTSNTYQLQTQLNDTTGTTSIDFENRTIYDDTGNDSIVYYRRELKDSTGAVTINYENRYITYPDGTQALNFATQDQITITGSVAAAGGFTGSLLGTASFAYTASNILGGKAPHIPYFITDTTLATSSIYQSGSTSVIINLDVNTTANPEALYVYQPHPTSFNVISGKGDLNNYLQLNIHNTSTGTSASSDVVATANNGDENGNYIDMGINSSNFNGPLGGPNDAYLYSTGVHLHIGNASNEYVAFFAGGDDVDAHNKLILNPDNQHQMTGSLDISGSLKVRGLSSANQANVVTIDSTTGQLYYTASSAFGGGGSGVSQILTGSGISISPTNGVGVVTITATGGSGGDFVTTSSFNNYTGSNASTFAGTAATASYSPNFNIAQTLTLDATLTDYSAISPSTSPGPNNLFILNTGSYTSAFGKYTIYDGSNSRAGEFVTSWNGTTVSYYDNSTVDIGDTSAITFVSSIVSGQIQINTGVSTPSGWQVKMLATFM